MRIESVSIRVVILIKALIYISKYLPGKYGKDSLVKAMKLAREIDDGSV